MDSPARSANVVQPQAAFSGCSHGYSGTSFNPPAHLGERRTFEHVIPAEAGIQSPA